MKPSVLAKLNQAAQRLEEVTQSLASEAVTKDLERYRRLSREYAELLPIAKAFSDWQNIQSDLI